ncbi:hypothetical protein Plim_1822 [Planctopirus limnophila DSM 3776]|uniref:Uncharacterized protein n=1 Tax=Planctopirus limnophila (strain ATCC 43296 / DSM 3776 / IFAM 1008 / Mu 290) TaxID=521674 RepID=D5SYC4_PLAL2|nr:hypothetical protein [Planctopirus limnophila]ADG67652.1 hypothetical protein Plim_1822 [Planctopirus limnophila DSM 3776]
MRRRGLCVWVLVSIFVFSGLIEGVAADDLGLQRINVPANQPEQWPKGNWSAIPREEFAEWLKKIEEKKSRPTRSRLHKAIYHLKVVDQRLEGTFELNLAGTSLPAGELLDLTPVNLAVKNTSWKSGQPAVLGLAGNDRQYLWIDGKGNVSNDPLTGECLVSGTRLPQSLFFRLGLFPADLTQVHLEVPQGYELASSAGVLTRDKPQDEKSSQSMLLSMAGLAECELTFTRKPDQNVLASHLIYEEDVTALIREDELRFLTTLSIETPDRVSIRELKIKLPDNFEIISATLGADTVLPWKRSANPATDSSIVLTLPAQTSGRLRAIRLEGTLPGNVLPMVSIPQVELAHATLLRGRATVSVISPLQVRNVEMEGYRESGPVTVTADGEVFTYDRQALNSSLKLEVRRPIPRFTATSSTILYGALDHWRIQSHVDWQVSSGALQQAVVSVPPGWDITEVTGEDESSRLADWEIQRDSTRSSLIMLEFALPASPGQPRRIRISARRSFPSTPGKIPIPAIKPSNAESTDYLLAVKVESAGKAVPGANSRYESTALPTSIDPRYVRDIQSFSTSLKPEDFSWYRATDPQVTGDLEFSSQLTPLKTTAQVLVTAHEALIHELFVLNITSEGPPPQEVLIFISEPGEDINWLAFQGEEATRLESRRANNRTYAEWGYPETGELWLLTPKEWSRGQLTIVGSRQRPQEAATIGLAFMPQATQFEGHVFLETSSLQGDEIVTTLLGSETRPDVNVLKFLPQWEKLPDHETNGSPIPNEPLPAAQKEKSQELSWKRFEYRLLDSQLKLQSPLTTAELNGPIPAEIFLTAQLPATLGGIGQVQLEYRLPENRQSRLFNVNLPEGWRLKSIRCDGTDLPLEIVNQALPNTETIRWNRLELEIEGVVAQQWLRQQMELPLPRTPLVILSGTLTLQVPPQVDVSAISGGWFPHQSTGPAWTERWFGPLGRKSSETIFDPLSRPVSKLIAGKEATRQATAGMSDQHPEDLAVNQTQWKTFCFSLPEIAPTGTSWNTAIGTSTVPQNDRLEKPDTASIISSSSFPPTQLTFFNRNDVQQANWAILLGTILVGVVVIAWFPRKGVMSLFLLGVTTAAIHPWWGVFEQSLAGSFLTGILLLLVIPPRLWTYQLAAPSASTVPAGSTLSYRLPIQSMAMLLGTAIWWRVLTLGWIASLLVLPAVANQLALPFQNLAGIEAETAQESTVTSENSTENLRPLPTTIDPDDPAGPLRSEETQLRELLVPVDAQGNPAAELPLVYLHPETARRLKALAVDIPARLDTLLGNASYVGKWGPGKQVIFEVTCGLWVLPGANEAEIKIPVPNRFLGGRNSVLLDGSPASVQRSRENGEILLLKLPADTTVKSPVYHEMKLQLRPARTDNHSGFSQVVPLLGTLQTALSWPDFKPDEIRFSTGTSMASSAESSDFRQWLGPLRQIFLRTAVDAKADNAAQVSNHLLEQTHRELVNAIATIHPDSIQITHQSRIWLKHETMQSLKLPIPKSLVVRSLRSDRLLHWYREIGLETDFLNLELRSVAEPTLFTETIETGAWVSVELLAILPKQPSQQAIIQLDQWSAAQGDSTIECDYQLTTDCNPEFRLSTPANPSVATKAAGVSGHEGTGNGVQSLAVSASKIVSRSSKPFQIEFALSPATPVIKTIEWRQFCTVINQRIEVDYIATIETDDYPMFSHRWSIDRRLQIENVSITQGGAERLVRVSDERRRDQGRTLTMLLSSPLKGIHTVHIHGSISLRNQRTVPLPKFELAGAPPVPGTLLVRSLPQVAVTVDGMLEKLSSTELQFPEVKGISSTERGTFKNLAYRWNLNQTPTLTVTPILTSFPATSITLVDLQDAQRIGLKTWIHLDIATHGINENRFEIELPSALRDSNHTRLTSEWGNIRELDAQSGRFELIRHGMTQIEKPISKEVPRATSTELVIQCESDLVLPREQNWTIPLPAIDQVSYQEHLVMVVPIDADVKLLKSIPGRSSTPFPAWVEKFVGNSLTNETSPIISTGPEPPILSWGMATNTIPQAQAQHVIWFGQQGGTPGISYFQIDPREINLQNQQSIQLKIAAEITPDAVIVNQRFRPITNMQSGQISLELDSSKPNVIRLFWHRRGKPPTFQNLWGLLDPQTAFGYQEMTVPYLVGVAPQEHRVLLVSSPAQQVVTNSRDFSRANSSAPIKVLHFLPPLSKNPSPFRRAEATDQLPEDQQALTLQSLLTQEETLPQYLKDDQSPEEMAMTGAQPLKPSSGHRRATWMLIDFLAKQTFEYRLSSGIWYWISWSTGLLLLGGYLFSRLSPVGLRDWLIEHPHAAYALLGLVWWLAFAASAAGFAVCIGALASSLWSRFKRWKTRPQHVAA